MAAAAAGAMVLVNSVVAGARHVWAGCIRACLDIVRLWGRVDDRGPAVAAVLDRVPDRPVMVGGAVLMVLTLMGLAVGRRSWPGLADPARCVVARGTGYSAVLTPSGRLLRRSAHPEDRPALFAAQFALSHACWLVTYPLSGWLMTRFGPVVALGVLAALPARASWPRSASGRGRSGDLGTHPRQPSARSPASARRAAACASLCSG